MSVEAKVLRLDHSIIDQFMADMRANGIDIDEPIVADGKRHRYYVRGDKRNSRNAWAILHIDDHPAGVYGYWKMPGERFKWSMKGSVKLTPAERKQLKETARRRKAERDAEIAIEHEAAAQRAQQIIDAGVPVQTHPYLVSKGVPSSEKLRAGAWHRIDEDTGEVTLVSDCALLVMLRDTASKTHSVQAIFEDERQPSGFRKLFLKGGATEGHYFPIGLPKDETVLICEGLATGLSLWQCTGHAVLVAFNANNLIHVARAFHALRPHFRLVICADNDAWTTNGPLDNPGVHYARKAAVAVNGVVAIPRFLRTETKPTDFNDLHQLEGELIVQEIVAQALAPVDREDVTPPPTPTTDPAPITVLPLAVPLKRGGVGGGGEDESDQRSRNEYFKIMGYDHGEYWFYSYLSNQLLTYSNAGFTDNAFLEMATQAWWEEQFPGEKGGINKKLATEWLMHTAFKRGVFTPDRRRGRGAWLDRGRQVFHHGRYLTVDGVKMKCPQIVSQYIYEHGASFSEPADVGLTAAEGVDILDLAMEFRWVQKGSAALLCGWIMLAPICGALKWRPHIWVTGNAGSGKSTIVESFVNTLLSAVDPLYVGASSTEPGIRQMLGADARPVIFDESEQNEDKDVTRMQNVLALMRSASSESQALTVKGSTSGTAMYFHIRSMFCLASIQVGVKHQADHERLSLLKLQPKLQTSLAAEQWEMLRDRIYEKITADPTISARLFRRSIDMLTTILANVEVFRGAAARIFKSQRAGDQYGTLLAGCWALIDDREATVQHAEWFINSLSWTDHIEETDSDEGQRLLSDLWGATVRIEGGRDLTVFEVVSIAFGRFIPTVEVTREKALALLPRYGMRVFQDHLCFANTGNGMDLLLSKSRFKDWRGIMQRIPGIDKNNNQPVRINGTLTKVLRMNPKFIFDDDSIDDARIDEPMQTQF